MAESKIKKQLTDASKAIGSEPVSTRDSWQSKSLLESIESNTWYMVALLNSTQIMAQLILKGSWLAGANSTTPIYLYKGSASQSNNNNCYCYASGSTFHYYVGSNISGTLDVYVYKMFV